MLGRERLVSWVFWAQSTTRGYIKADGGQRCRLIQNKPANDDVNFLKIFFTSIQIWEDKPWKGWFIFKALIFITTDIEYPVQCLIWQETASELNCLYDMQNVNNIHHNYQM